MLPLPINGPDRITENLQKSSSQDQGIDGSRDLPFLEERRLRYRPGPAVTLSGHHGRKGPSLLALPVALERLMKRAVDLIDLHLVSTVF